MSADSSQPFADFTLQWRPRVEEMLDELLPRADHPPTELHAAMRYALFPGGKRLRPMLALLGCKVTGGDLQRALPSAAAVELLHTYSLVHDDLPCMDDDDLRRGRPTCHKVYGEALTILVGDALLTLSMEVVASGGVDAVRTLARATGSTGMVGGQAVDLQSEGVDGATPEQVTWVHTRKTAALISASLLVGARAGGGDTSTLDSLEEYGRLVGLAFQVADDCLDITGTEQSLGKRPGQDVAAQKMTFPAVMGLSASRDTATDLARQAGELAIPVCSWSAEPLESEISLLRDAARFSVTRIS